MKRVLLITLGLFIFLVPIGIYLYNIFGPLPILRQGSTDKNIVEVRSEYPGFTISKTRYFNELYAYLDHIGFWKEQAILDPVRLVPVTVKRMTVVFTNEPQSGGLHVVTIDGTKLQLSSFSASFIDGEITLRIFVNPSVAKVTKLKINNSFSTVLLRASYLMVKHDATNWEAQTQTAQVLVNKWFKQSYVDIRSMSGKLRILVRFFIPVVFAADCAEWSCGTMITDYRCSNSRASCNVDADCASGCTPVGCDPDGIYPCTCSITGSCNPNTICGLPEFSESAMVCGPGCPPGHCTTGYQCSCILPSATPVTNSETCGNGTCGSGENCSNCASDCGACPEPPPPGSTNTPTPSPMPSSFGIIRARAVVVDAADISCTAARSVPITDGQINGTTFEFTPSSASQPAPIIQIGANLVRFSNIVSGSYVIMPTLPSVNWVHAKNCWKNQTTGATGENLFATLGANEILRWDIGYTLGSAWVQTEGGDVYASGSIKSFLPDVTPRVFNTNGTGGYPGIVIYGTTKDFDSDPFSTGDTLVSSQNWQVDETRTTVDYYDFFYKRYHSPTTVSTDPAFSNPLAVTKPASGETPHYVVGNITTSGNWSVGANESIVIIVNGNVAIGGRINITGNGFIAFIVNGTITVADTVGTTTISETPVVEGIYIATKADRTGSFNTGSSIAAGTARLVGSGMFIADNFSLDRDLDGFGVGNTGASAELFTYNPQLLLTMPDTMKELTVTWQEVAP